MIYSELKSFGYPVINPYGDDFLQDKFTSEVNLNLHENDGKLEAKVSHSLPDFFKKLFINKKVKFLTVLRCNFTSFEDHRIYYEMNKDLTFSSKDCFDKISIESYIVCNETLKIGKEIDKKYINDFYHSLNRTYNKNTLIGFSKPSQFSLSPKLNAPITSIFVLKESTDVEKGCVAYDFGDELISIYFHKDDLIIYKRIGNSSGKEQKFHLNILINAVLIPALSAALLAYSSNSEDNSQLWKSTLYTKLNDLNYNVDHIKPEDINTLANKIIYFDKDKGLKQLNESINFILEEDYED